MKRKLFFALIAILTVGLMFVGCPSGSNPGTGKDPSAFEKLEPWAPTQISEPASYIDFPKGTARSAPNVDDGTGLLGKTAFYVSKGGSEEGWIEEGENGTYKVTVLTNPGGLSLISFQDADYVYKTGYYLSLDLPTADAANPHKPIMAVAYTAVGPQETGNNWNNASRANMKYDNTLDQDSVYLAGRIDFAWEKTTNIIPYRTLCLRLHWHADEEAGAEYTFTVRKILVSDDADLAPPEYPFIPWAPASIPVPTSWTDFPAAGITGATYDTATESNKSVTVTTVTGGYSLTIPTYPGGYTEITFPTVTGSDFYTGYYIALVLPKNDDEMSLRPNRVYSYPNSYWGAAVDLNPDEDDNVSGTGYYVAGNVDMQWTGTSTTTLNNIKLQFYWHSDEPSDGEYTFTLKALKITSGDYEPPEPPLYPGVVTGVKAYLQETATWGGTWGNQYEDVPNTTLSIDYTTELATATAYNQFVLDLYFPADGVGKDYQFTISDVKMLNDSATNTLTDAEILAGVRGGNNDNNWASQSGVVTKIGNTYRVKMTIIADGEAGIAKLVITRTATTTDPVKKYGFKAALPKTYALATETSPTVTEPIGWVTFPGSETLTATYYPWATGTTGNTITAAFDPGTSARTLVRLSGGESGTFKYKKGIYVSVTLPNNSLQPNRIIAYPSTTKDENGIAPSGNWSYCSDISASAGKFLSGKVDFHWANDAATNVFQGIVLDIYWAEGQMAAPYSFTISSIKVAEETNEAPPAETPTIHESSQLADATYTKDAAATALVVVPKWTANSANYQYIWYKTPDGTIANSNWISDGTANSGSQGSNFTPPTDTVGVMYYFVKIVFGSESTFSTPSTKITVTN